MTNRSPQNKRRISTPIIIAIITLAGVCITTLGVIVVGIFPSILEMFDTNSAKVEAITFRVTEVSGTSVPHAKVILLSGNDIHIQYTDSNGVGTFSLIKAEMLRIFVETDQYEIYDQIFTANTPSPIEIRLKPKDISRKSIIVRIIDNKDDIPINGAEVILIVNGNIYSQTTDSNGITKFTTAFPTDEIDGNISVSVSGFKAEHQRVTLQADRVQDIRLDKTLGTLTVGFTGQGKEVARTPEADIDATNPDNNQIVFNCSRESLSPEEIANCGSHDYQYVLDMSDDVDCYFGDTNSKHEEGTDTIIIEFPKYSDKMSFNTEIYIKTDTNTYYKQYLGESSDTRDIITFNMNGFKRHLEDYFYSNPGVLGCDYLGEYVFKN